MNGLVSGYATPGVGLISTAPHHDIYSIEDLGTTNFDLKKCNSKDKRGSLYQSWKVER